MVGLDRELISQMPIRRSVRAGKELIGPLHRAAHRPAIEATIDAAPTVAMKRGDTRDHSYKIDCLADPAATL